MADHNDMMNKRPYYVGITMPTMTPVEPPCPPSVIYVIRCYDKSMLQYSKREK